MSKIITQEEYRKRCGEYGFTPISPYVSAKSKIEVMCNKHSEEFITTLTQIKRCRCPKCYEENNNTRLNKIRLTNKDVDIRLKDRDILRIGDVCGRHEKIEWQCKACNHKWLQTPGNIIHEKNPTGCPKCKGGIKDAAEDFILKIQDRKDLVLTGKYINSQTKTSFKCVKCDFQWEAKPANILNLGRGCPCCKLKSEKAVGDILFKNNIFAKHNYYIKTAERSYLIDWFVEETGIAIEYNGEQHYRPVKFGGASDLHAHESFQKQKIRDSSLREYCKNNNIFLIEIDGRKYNHKNQNSMEDYIINSIRGITNV